MSITPGRSTVVTLDVPSVTNYDASWYQDLAFEKIPSSTIPPVNMTLIKGVGWQLTEYQASGSYMHETSIADSAVRSLNVPSGILAVNTNRIYSELTGVDYSAVRTGDAFWEKRVSATTPDWSDGSYRLTGDMTAFPSPAVPSAFITMDRVAIDTAMHFPDTTIYSRLNIPASSKDSLGAVDAITFIGIPSNIQGETAPGDGHYQIVRDADGTFELYERQSGTGIWKLRVRGKWCPPALVCGQSHWVSIRQDAFLNPDTNKWQGTQIVFGFSNQTEGFLSAVIDSVVDMFSPNLFIYSIPGAGPCTITPDYIRVDCRRDITAQFQISQAKYFPTGTLTTRLQQLPNRIFGTANPIFVTAFGIYPQTNPGSVTCQLVCPDTGTTIAPTAVIAPFAGNQYSYYQWQFPTINDTSQYYAVLTSNASGDQLNKTTIQRVTFNRAPQSKLVTPTPIVVPVVSRISTTGPDADPTHESFSFVAPDVEGALSMLDKRAGMQVACDLYYDPVHPTKFSRLFYGSLISAPKSVRGPINISDDYAVDRWGIYQADCLGEWTRLIGMKAPKRYNFAGAGPDGKAPWLITSILNAILLDQGYLPQQIDIPASPIRLFTQPGSNSEMLIEPFADIAPMMLTLIRQYLGGWLIFDANATNGGTTDDVLGCWRVRIPPSPPYVSLCDFFTSSQGPGFVVTYKTTGMQVSPQIPVRKGIQPKVILPEGNWVCVDGAGGAGVLSANSGFTGLRRTIYNWSAADFGQGISGPKPPPDPTHPDWTNGQPLCIYYSNPYLQTQQAVDWMARRIEDYSCHAKSVIPVEAPLVLVWDSTDPLQIRARPLRYGDPVTYNGAPYYIGSTNAGYGAGQSKNAMAAYDLIQVPALTADYSQSGKDEQFKAKVGRMNELA